MCILSYVTNHETTSTANVFLYSVFPWHRERQTQRGWFREAQVTSQGK